MIPQAGGELDGTSADGVSRSAVDRAGKRGSTLGGILVVLGSLLGAFAVFVLCNMVSSSLGWKDLGSGLQVKRHASEVILIVGVIAAMPLVSVILIVLGNKLGGSWRDRFSRLWIALGLLLLVGLPFWLGRTGDTTFLVGALLLCVGGVGAAAGVGNVTSPQEPSGGPERG